MEYGILGIMFMLFGILIELTWIRRAIEKASR